MSIIVNQQNYYKILWDIEVHTPGLDDRVSSAPPGPIDIYEEHLQVGLRFSLHPFFIKVFNWYQVIPT